MKTKLIPMNEVPELFVIKEHVPQVKGLFFDMDGTLFNTENIHADALLVMAKKYQIKPPISQQEVYEMMVGRADHLLFDIIKNWEGVPKDWTVDIFINEKNKNFVQILERKSLETFFSAKVHKLLKEAHLNGMFMGLVTSSERIITEEILKIAQIKNFFNFILTRDDCLKCKPDPWPYEKALELSGFKKHEVIVFEDSKVGLEAALLSGAHVIKVQWYET
jgi:HAD superfamily hydrolase (TIGR01509 family)